MSPTMLEEFSAKLVVSKHLRPFLFLCQPAHTRLDAHHCGDVTAIVNTCHLYKKKVAIFCHSFPGSKHADYCHSSVCITCPVCAMGLS